MRWESLHPRILPTKYVRTFSFLNIKLNIQLSGNFAFFNVVYKLVWNLCILEYELSQISNMMVAFALT
jgi:hypothetical protein